MITPTHCISVYTINDIRKHIQECANSQWNSLNPKRMVCVGIKKYPSLASSSKEEVIEWFSNMRELFDLGLPETLIIQDGSYYLLVSSEKPTLAEK